MTVELNLHSHYPKRRVEGVLPDKTEPVITAARSDRELELDMSFGFECPHKVASVSVTTQVALSLRQFL